MGNEVSEFIQLSGEKYPTVVLPSPSVGASETHAWRRRTWDGHLPPSLDSAPSNRPGAGAELALPAFLRGCVPLPQPYKSFSSDGKFRTCSVAY